MKTIVLNAMVAGVLIVVASGRANAGEYPIHFDGPLVNHVAPSLDASGLPKFGVAFHGGPVQISTVSYSIYWQPAGTYMSAPYKTLLDRFLSDVGGSPIYGMATSYVGSNGQVTNQSVFSGATIDTTPYPKGGPHDKDLQAVIASAIAANNWPTGLGAQYFIFTARGAVQALGYCAYHSAFSYEHDRSKPVVYAFMPYVGYFNGCDPPYGISPNNDVDSDGSIISVSHEQMEMVTDPLLDAWWGSNGGEIGDICIYSFGIPFGRTGANLVINRHPYFLQEDWTQRKQSCQPNL